MKLMILGCVISYYISFVAPTWQSIVSVMEFEPYEMTEEDLAEEIELGDMELLAQLVEAEAGDQSLEGMRLVVDVVLNRVDSPNFPDTIEDVIYQNNQFSVIKDGAFDRAAWHISEDCYRAVELEWEERLDYGVLYFSATKHPVNGKNAFKNGDHWFSY